jgi:hypothetical protein
MNPNGTHKIRRVGAAVALAFAGLWVAMACLAQMQSRAAAERDPWVALGWDAANPVALTRMAELFAGSRRHAADSQAAVELARSAMLRAPLNGAALRVLGFEADRAGDAAAARRLMEASDRLTKRDTVAQLWLLTEAIRERDYANGLTKSEAVLRRDPGVAPLVYEILGGTLGEPAAVSVLAARLAARPAWRTRFLTAVTAKGPSVDQALRLYAALEARRSPASPEEAEALVQRLIAERRYAQAYALWRIRAGGAAAANWGGIYAGNFRARPGAPPFNWRLSDKGEAFAELGDGPDGAPSLHVQFQTGSTEVLAEQILLATPGRYRLDGAAWLATDLAARATGWRIECAESGAVILDQRFDAATPGGWRPFTAEYETPAQGCAAQRLKLLGLALDRFDTIEAWHRDLRLTKVSASPAPVGEAAPAVAAVARP